MPRRRKVYYNNKDDSDADPEYLDDQQQDELIEQLLLEKRESEDLFKAAFLGLTLFQTPLFVVLPYCRHNSLLALLSLISLLVSAYTLHFTVGKPITTRTPLKKRLSFSSPSTFSSWLSPSPSAVIANVKSAQRLIPAGNIILTLMIVAWGLFKHHPWYGFDYIWCLPLISGASTLWLVRWSRQVQAGIDSVVKLKYKLAGA
ncbi:hypothetical protein NADFUDRAFT_66234 [Nadsonia fulvescens var. elongata DSM 6958]|uniref:Uncharacterized protein n=1 Tax=Nadsonia fulvescens var. elongata DSM 6958 TaxID=857566 RepID=A0A1E3PJV4_9ASCO|nr:hypothetical protein NADFUDRAFT_66234 [Nadsonia fulvescens var. elongata DSM 6958]